MRCQPEHGADGFARERWHFSALWCSRSGRLMPKPFGSTTREVPLLNYQLIAASAEDQAWLENLRRNVYQELFFATWGGWDEARHKRHFSECIARGHIFIIEVDSTRVGMIQIFEQANALEVGEIQVQPGTQNGGVGTAVLKEIIARAHEGRKSVRLSVGLKNERAYRLYERLGFHCVGRTATHHHMVCEPRP